MDFELDDDQLALQGAAQEILAKECPPALIRAVAEGHDRGDRLWSTLVGLDWPGLAVEAEAGGSGATEVELAIVVEQLGHVADPTPFLATTTQYVPLVQASTDDEQRRQLLGAIAAGGTGTVALATADGRWDLTALPVRAERTAGGWALSGSASFVLDGDRAEEVAVVATTGDGPDARPVVVVVAGAEVATERRPALDPTLHVATVDVGGITVADDRVLALDDPAASVTAALELAVTGLALSMVGACQRAFDLAIVYSKERHQFDVPIGSFQALKHKAVDLYTLIERARALGQFAALCIAVDDPRRTAAAAMAKAAAGDAQHLVFRHTIQFFGGIGFTWENDLHLYLRRAKAGELLLGGAAHHRAALGRSELARRLAATGS